MASGVQKIDFVSLARLPKRAEVEEFSMELKGLHFFFIAGPTADGCLAAPGPVVSCHLPRQSIPSGESFAALDPGTLRQCLTCVLDTAPTLLVIAHP
jgi:hypothetical protein